MEARRYRIPIPFEKMKIGITFGVFDLFHYGHENLLKRCRDYCDYLVVGVVTDYWVKVQKGHDRPIQNVYDRIESVKPYADKVVIVDTLDMSQYLQMADIWIKTIGQNNMRPTFYPNIVVLPRTPGISTTELIAAKNQNN